MVVVVGVVVGMVVLVMVIENIVPTFKQLSLLQAINEHMTSVNHYVNIQLANFISS